MPKSLSKLIAIISAFIDGLLVTTALYLTIFTQPHLPSILGLVESMESPLLPTPYFFLLVVVIWLFILLSLGIYDREKNIRVVDEIYTLIIGAGLSSIIFAAILYISQSDFPRFSYFSFILLTLFLLILPRLIYRVVFQAKVRQNVYQQRILIAGAGHVGRSFAKEFDDFSELGYRLIGFVDDDPKLIDTQPNVLGSIDQVPSLIKQYQIDNLIIALPHEAYERINSLMQAVHILPIRVWVIPDYFALMLSRSSIWNFVGIPMITIQSPPLNNGQRILKRLFDLIIVIPMLILTLPLFGLIALLIKIDSSGPVFYRATRVKEYGETFEMLKFRTMVDHANDQLADVMFKDQKGKLHYKKPNDPRLTTVGRVLRKTSLDELPNLFNIIKGEMSLVGPRPELPELVEYYQPWQHMRFAVPQGLTGWWQVNGRSDKPMHLHTDEDLYYIQHYSIWLDIKILIKTVLIVLRGKGAY
jgi:exopolysaccharide biosynthesis polyprenyl glycosylphosphotransferase